MRAISFFPLLTALVLAASLALPRTATAETTNDTGFWLSLSSNGSLCADDAENPWRWWFDGHLRYFDDDGGFGQSLVRPGVGYQLTDSTTVWAGYAWIHTEPGNRSPFEENRLWQQVTWGETFELGRIDLRSRLEERLLETGDDTGLRFRQLFALRRPLECAPQFTLVAWDEIFFHLNDTDWGARSGFDQNRAFLGIGWKPTPECDWRIEIGYLNQFIDRNAPTDVSNHLLSVNLFWNP